MAKKNRTNGKLFPTHFTARTKRSGSTSKNILDYVPPPRPVLNAPIHKEIKKQLYAIGEKRKWIEEIDFNFKGVQVKGFIQLLEVGSYTSNPGLVLFRYKRVVMGTTRQPYIPESLFGTANKYGKQRIYGELHLDGLQVSYTKDKFEFDEDEFINLIKSEPKILELLKQSGDYRAGGSPISIASEDVLKDQDKDTKSKPGGSSDGDTKTDPKKGKGNTAKPEPEVPGFVQILQSLKTASLGLNDIINECIQQYSSDHPISTALCLRVILESGALSKIERDKKSQYPKVATMGIQNLIKYMSKDLSMFFAQTDHKASKCVQSLATGSQADIIFLNNISHGHYHPSIDELNKLIANIQPLLEWAYS